MIHSKCSFYIDGFNFYHSIADGPLPNKFKWFDYMKMAEAYLPADSILDEVRYYSAYAYWRPDSEKRHRALVQASRAQGVIVRLGKFKEKGRKCFQCNSYWKDHEEKQTDINIAIDLVTGAFQNKYDKAILVSGDTDLVPAINRVKDLFPHKKVGVLFPPGRAVKELMHTADFYHKLYPKQIKKFRLPDEVQVETRDGRTRTIRCPDEYK